MLHEGKILRPPPPQLHQYASDVRLFPAHTFLNRVAHNMCVDINFHMLCVRVWSCSQVKSIPLRRRTIGGNT
jgi:hypothetical protein